MSAAKEVTATFAAETRQLKVGKSGSGTVTSSPAGINCGATCSFGFNLGVTVTLTATADSGSEFKGWSGACAGTGSCEVTMSSAKEVSAQFATIPPVVDPPVVKPPVVNPPPKKPTNAEKLQKALKKCKKLKGKAKTKCIAKAKKQFKPKARRSARPQQLEHRRDWWRP